MPQPPKKPDRASATDVSEEKVDKPAEDDPSFTIERLTRQAADFFPDRIEGVAVDAAVLAGAYAGVKPSTETTLKDAKTRIRQWLRAPVETDPREDA